MRRAALVVVLAAAAVVSSACSGGDQPVGVPAPATAASGPLPSSQQFDRPFPVGGETWDATVTLSGLRIVPSSDPSGSTVAVDVRAVQSSGRPEIGPGDFSAFDPSGKPFARIDSPAGIVPDPLVPSVMESPGQEIRGTVVWTMPRGSRIGRIELATPRAIGSVIVTRQPADPSASPAQTPAG